MSNFINKEKLVAGTVFGDTNSNEYVYMPGGELGSATPLCVLEKNFIREDISLQEASEKIDRLNLKPLKLPPFGKI